MIRHLIEVMRGIAPRGYRRSRLWPALEKDFLRNNPTCHSCGGTKKLVVHHVIPYHYDTFLELEDSNLMTLCTDEKYGINCLKFCGYRGTYSLHNNEDARDVAENVFLYLHGLRVIEGLQDLE